MNNTDSEGKFLNRMCFNCKKIIDTKEIKECDNCFKSLCQNCLYLPHLEFSDKKYSEWLHILSYDELKLWETNLSSKQILHVQSHRYVRIQASRVIHFALFKYYLA